MVWLIVGVAAVVVAALAVDAWWVMRVEDEIIDEDLGVKEGK